MRALGLPLLDPSVLATKLLEESVVRVWSPGVPSVPSRVTYYDALPDDGQPPNERMELFWEVVEAQPNVQLGFGSLRGLQRKVRQKGVDTLIAVDVLVGAFSGIYDLGILVAGDADFVPVVEEARRRGVAVVVAGWNESMSPELSRPAGRYVTVQRHFVQAMLANGEPVGA